VTRGDWSPETLEDVESWLEDNGGFWLVTELDGVRVVVISAYGRSSVAEVDDRGIEAVLVRACRGLQMRI
jgi:hypothetical protein